MIRSGFRVRGAGRLFLRGWAGRSAMANEGNLVLPSGNAVVAWAKGNCPPNNVARARATVVGNARPDRESSPGRAMRTVCGPLEGCEDERMDRIRVLIA